MGFVYGGGAWAFGQGYPLVYGGGAWAFGLYVFWVLASFSMWLCVALGTDLCFKRKQI
jgi:hypothetical protein